jgi:hypothetical protein
MQEDQRKDCEMQCKDGTGKMPNLWNEEEEEEDSQELIDLYRSH